MTQGGGHIAACGTGAAGIAKEGREFALLQLPSPLLERIVLSCGSQGAGACCSCRAVSEAWHAVTTPAGAARYLIARYGPHDAVQHVYGCPGLLKAVTRGAPRHSHDALTLGVLRALCEAGCCAAGQTDAVLVPAAAAGHVTVAQWALQGGATALHRALRAACTHGHMEMVVLLLGALGAGRREAKAASSPEEVQDDGDGAGDDHNEGSMLGAEHFPGAPPTPPVVPLPLPLLLSTALGDAATCGDRAVVELLLEAGANARHDHWKALINAATWGNEGAVLALLAAGAVPHYLEQHLLLAAASHGHGGVVRQLLAAGADAAANGIHALCVAAQNGHAEVVSHLLAAGADGGYHDGLPLCVAAQRGHEGVVRQLLDQGVPYMARDGHALLAAAKEGHAGVVQLLLEAGPWPQETLSMALRFAKYMHWFDAPTLSEATRRGRQEAAQALVAAGAKTSISSMPWAGAVEAMICRALEAFRHVVPEPSSMAVAAVVTAVLLPIPLVTTGVPLWLVWRCVRKAFCTSAR